MATLIVHTGDGLFCRMTRLTYVVGITGGAAAGKSTLAHALASALPDAQVISEDNYIHGIEALGGASLTEINFDDPSTRDHALMLSHLVDLRAGTQVAVPAYDFVTGHRTGLALIRPGKFILFEGIHLGCESRLWSAFDLRIFVNAPEEIRLRRWVDRNTRERGQTIEVATTRFSRDVKPMFALHTEPSRQTSDLVIDVAEESEGTEQWFRQVDGLQRRILAARHSAR